VSVNFGFGEGLTEQESAHFMKILITGNMGYVGPVVAAHLRAAFPGAVLIGYDTGYFAGCLVQPLDFPERVLEAQHFGDLRRFPAELLNGVDAVVHLAAISNDPMGNAFEAVTEEINFGCSMRLAELAKTRGVRHFAFASSCSVYGAAGTQARREDDELNPLTAYARSKVATEQGLRALADPGFTVTCLRFATACGFSPRLRLDLVLNDFVASALSTGEITILSDGTPWRPLIDVRDMARALEWAVTRPADSGGDYLVVNAGASAANYQVRELAETVRQALPGVVVNISKDGQPDKRSYKVDFGRYAALAPKHQPQCALAESVRGLVEGLRAAAFRDARFRESSYIRLNVLRRYKDTGQLTAELYWN
jgi:nucleoside-diphosphate-sugar epimerase